MKHNRYVRAYFKGPINTTVEVHNADGSMSEHQFTHMYAYYGDKESIAGPDGVQYFFKAQCIPHYPGHDVEQWIVADIRRQLEALGYGVSAHTALMEPVGQVKGVMP